MLCICFQMKYQSWGHLDAKVLKTKLRRNRRLPEKGDAAREQLLECVISRRRSSDN